MALPVVEYLIGSPGLHPGRLLLRRALHVGMFQSATETKLLLDGLRRDQDRLHRRLHGLGAASSPAAR